MNLKDAKVLITGGSQGIGFATAKILVEAGANVVISARDEPRLIIAAESINAKYVQADVSDEDSVHELFLKTIDKLDGLNVVINNAAYGYFSTIDQIETDAFQKMLQTNLMGAMFVGRESAKYFISKNYGNIINISSTAGLNGFASGSAYVASKFALKGMTECWRAELRKHNIRVMLVNPSEVQTEFVKNSGREVKEHNATKLMSEDLALTMKSILELDDRAFIPELSVWATNPRN